MKKANIMVKTNMMMMINKKLVKQKCHFKKWHFCF
jgi:hypothetical protein